MGVITLTLTPEQFETIIGCIECVTGTTMCQEEASELADMADELEEQANGQA